MLYGLTKSTGTAMDLCNFICVILHTSVISDNSGERKCNVSVKSVGELIKVFCETSN
jgi:hypothetical protein